MSWVDIVIIAVAIVGALAGYKQGLIVSVFSFLGLVVGVATAGAVSDTLAEKLSSNGALWAHIVSFALIVIVVMVAFHILAIIVKGLLKVVMLGWVDSFGGAFLGLWVGGLLTAALFIVIGKWAAGQPETTAVGNAIGNSALANFLIAEFRFLLGLLPSRFDAVVELFT